MITYGINMNGGKNVWRYRNISKGVHCERLWREGKYVGPKGRFKISGNGINTAGHWSA